MDGSSVANLMLLLNARFLKFSPVGGLHFVHTSLDILGCTLAIGNRSQDLLANIVVDSIANIVVFGFVFSLVLGFACLGVDRFTLILVGGRVCGLTLWPVSLWVG